MDALGKLKSWAPRTAYSVPCTLILRVFSPKNHHFFSALCSNTTKYRPSADRKLNDETTSPRNGTESTTPSSTLQTQCLPWPMPSMLWQSRETLKTENASAVNLPVNSS